MRPAIWELPQARAASRDQNPVMFVIEINGVLTTLILIRD
jgi:hypothetical protein